jgi:hypothetical protein
MPPFAIQVIHTIVAMVAKIPYWALDKIHGW